MPLHLHQPLARIISLGAFVALWLGALIFLAQDGCFDHGGALVGSGFACAQADGSTWGVSVMESQLSNQQIITFNAVNHAMLICYTT